MLGNTTGNRNIYRLRWVVLARWEMGESLGVFFPILTLLERLLGFFREFPGSSRYSSSGAPTAWGWASALLHPGQEMKCGNEI